MIKRRPHFKHAVKGRALFVLLSAILLISTTTNAFAEERCGIPPEVDQLIDTMRMIASADEPISVNTQATLNFQLNRAAKLMAEDRSNDLGLGGWKTAFDWVFAHGKEALATGRMLDPDKTHQQIGTLTAGLRFVCDARVTRGTTLATNSSTSSDGERNNIKGNGLISPSHEGSTRLLVTIFLAAITLVAAIWAGNIAYKSIYALLNNRRSCHIYGSLEIGLDVIDGAIVILGAKGARFRPSNEGAYARIVKLVDTEEPMVFPPVLQIGQDRFAVEITALVDGHASCFFYEPVDIKHLNELLEHSTVKPRFAPQKIPKRNIGLPKDAIEEAAIVEEETEFSTNLGEGNIFGFDVEDENPKHVISADESSDDENTGDEPIGDATTDESAKGTGH